MSNKKYPSTFIQTQSRKVVQQIETQQEFNQLKFNLLFRLFLPPSFHLF